MDVVFNTRGNAVKSSQLQKNYVIKLRRQNFLVSFRKKDHGLACIVTDVMQHTSRDTRHMESFT